MADVDADYLTENDEEQIQLQMEVVNESENEDLKNILIKNNYNSVSVDH